MEKVLVTQTKNTFANGHIFRPGQTVEIVDSVLSGVWKGKDKNDWHRIPEDETSEWITERDGKWKPKMGEMYYYPPLSYGHDYLGGQPWKDSFGDRVRLNRNLVCQTLDQAIALTEHLIQAAKEWHEKQ